jgi:hypothetical protein
MWPTFLRLVSSAFVSAAILLALPSTPTDAAGRSATRRPHHSARQPHYRSHGERVGVLRWLPGVISRQATEVPSEEPATSTRYAWGQPTSGFCPACGTKLKTGTPLLVVPESRCPL